MQIGNEIQKIRVREKVSREELAHLVGVATTTVYRWEKEQQAPKFTDVVAISQALHVPVSAFVGEDEERTTSRTDTASLPAIFQFLANHSELAEMLAQMDDDYLEVLTGQVEARIQRNMAKAAGTSKRA